MSKRHDEAEWAETLAQLGNVIVRVQDAHGTIREVRVDYRVSLEGKPVTESICEPVSVDLARVRMGITDGLREALAFQPPAEHVSHRTGPGRNGP